MLPGAASCSVRFTTGSITSYLRGCAGPQSSTWRQGSVGGAGLLVSDQSLLDTEPTSLFTRHLKAGCLLVGATACFFSLSKHLPVHASAESAGCRACICSSCTHLEDFPFHSRTSATIERPLLDFVQVRFLCHQQKMQLWLKAAPAEFLLSNSKLSSGVFCWIPMTARSAPVRQTRKC